ncbi:MAG: precorrin-2 C(20)-methyltransferase [Firmicutes bacterium]|nr:precorrin-2 C(20)-methyltransferase [Bacillota bacterium]
MNRGKLFGVGVGPGDPELLTLKAVKIINECDILAVPETKDGHNIALNIVEKAVDVENKELIFLKFPMVNDKEVLEQSYAMKARLIGRYLGEGKNVCFIAVGDISIYSTFFHIQPLVDQMGFETEICPGVPSFCAVGARLKTSLTVMNKPLHIIPAVYGNINDCFELDGTKIFMKSGKNVSDIYAIAHERHLTAKGVSNCTMENEKLVCDPHDSFGYFTTLFVGEEW